MMLLEIRQRNIDMISTVQSKVDNSGENDMKSTPFNPETDLAPIPFTEEVCLAAKEMKERGLKWQPHVGCFVWDEKRLIEVSSPFPNRIYFILNLGHFLKRFETVENIAEQLVWLPTWQQARLIANQIGISKEQIMRRIEGSTSNEVGNELIELYNLISEKLSRSETLENK